jgi:hypothetical protein
VSRLGLDALLLHPDGEHAVSARELAREFLGVEPPEPEAYAQLAADHVAADIVARTVG